MTTDTSKSILILGCGGFIGSHLLERILATTEYHVYGIDIDAAKIRHCIDNEKFTFIEMNIYDSDAVRSYIDKCGIVISLVALCNPSLYNTIPLNVIDINFTHPYELVRACSESGTWLIHFSTCEVYGKTIAHFLEGNQSASDPGNYILKEDESPLIMGPISAQRWSYACAKQLLERVIYAYGFEKELAYTIVRPFNFIGSRMDYLPGIDGGGIPRVLACFMDALLMNKPLQLVDGGKNKRCFTYINDAVDAVVAILSHKQTALSQIFNIGNPYNEVSIAELAHTMVSIYKEIRPGAQNEQITIESVDSKQFYGSGYEDSDRRVPDIQKARRALEWEPKTGLENALRATMRAFIEEYASRI